MAQGSMHCGNSEKPERAESPAPWSHRDVGFVAPSAFCAPFRFLRRAFLPAFLPAFFPPFLITFVSLV